MKLVDLKRIAKAFAGGRRTVINGGVKQGFDLTLPAGKKPASILCEAQGANEFPMLGNMVQFHASLPVLADRVGHPKACKP